MLRRIMGLLDIEGEYLRHTIGDSLNIISFIESSEHVNLQMLAAEVPITVIIKSMYVNVFGSFIIQ